MAHKCKITPGKTENQLGMYFFTPPPLRASFFFFSKGWFVQWSPKSMIAPPQKVFLRKVLLSSRCSNAWLLRNLLTKPTTISKTLRSVHELQGCHILPKVSRGKAGDCDQSTRPSEVELVPHVFAHWPARVSWSSPGRSKSPNLHRKWGVKLQLSVLIWRKGFKFNKS